MDNPLLDVPESKTQADDRAKGNAVKPVAGYRIATDEERQALIPAAKKLVRTLQEEKKEWDGTVPDLGGLWSQGWWWVKDT